MKLEAVLQRLEEAEAQCAVMREAHMGCSAKKGKGGR